MRSNVGLWLVLLRLYREGCGVDDGAWADSLDRTSGFVFVVRCRLAALNFEHGVPSQMT
jgi:hypothetical protein